MREVSVFENYRSSIPSTTVSLDEWLPSSTYNKQVERIRKEPNPDKRRLMKSVLPCITPSGVFSRRCKAGLQKHSGFICIDIDGKENPGINDCEALKSTIAEQMEQLYYCGLSVSGNGLFCLIPISDPQRHAEYYTAIENKFADMGIVVDKMCKDVCRLRGASFDPAPIYNPNAKPFGCSVPVSRKCPSVSKIGTTATDTQISVSVSQSIGITAYRVGLLVEAIERTGTDITDAYADWFAIGRALANEFGEQGRGYYHAISQQSGKYSTDECDVQYNACLRSSSRTSIATLFYLCRRAGLTLENH